MREPGAARDIIDNRLFWWLLAMAMITLLLLLGWQLGISYRNQIKTAEINTHNIASILDARLDVTLRHIDADLKIIASAIPEAALNQKAVPRFAAEINSNLDGRMFDLEEMAGYRIHDANGDTLYSSDSANTARVNIADREYFKLLREDHGAGLVFSDAVIGRSNGKPVMVVLRGLRNPQGEFLGIVHGMINLEYYSTQFKTLKLGAQGIVALRRSDTHAMVVRYPEQSGQLNQPLAPDHPVVAQMASGMRSVTLHYMVPPESIPRIMGIEKMQNFPFYFAVGVGKDEVLAGWRQQVKVVVVVTLLLFGLVGLLLFRLRLMRQREAGMLSTLAKSESRFRELAQMVPVGICHFDAQGKYTYVNDRHVAITGSSREELLGQDWYRFVHSEDSAKLRLAWECAANSGSAFVYEYRYAHADGLLRHVQGEVQTDVDSDGRVVGYIAAVTDITLRKQAEAELIVAKQEAESANLAKTRFLAAASHDLRQPIQAINLFRDALVQTDLSAEQKTISGFLSKSVQSLGDLLYSLLDISKLDAGQIRPRLIKVNVEDLFKVIDAEFSTLARQKNLRFKLYYPFKDVILVTDPGLLMSVVRNLIDNALKYTKKGGVLVCFRKRGGNALIQVWDTGIGIEARYGEQIFEECFQVGNPVRDRAKGLGLGLSIARRMARLLKGQLNYRSRFARGTVFEIVLPQAVLYVPGMVREERTEMFTAVNPSSEKYSKFRGWRVVVVEDDPMVAKSIELSLTALGVRVDVFHSAEQAIVSPDVLGANFYFSDFSLPGLSGLQFLDVLQGRSSKPVNAVLLTGGTSHEQTEPAASMRWKVLFKPVELAALLSVMNEVSALEGG
jgi:PAS domain S-box-containing protein